jgi:hypothetical protein
MLPWLRTEALQLYFSQLHMLAIKTNVSIRPSKITVRKTKGTMAQYDI